jgi:membrane protease YdiL (CAAX protease family)
VTSLDGSVAERTPWQISDAVLAIVMGLLAAVLASAVVGAEPSAREVFGVVVPAQSLATLGTIALLSRARHDWRQALNVQWAMGDLMGLLVGAGLQVGLSIVAYAVIVGVFGGEAPTQDVVEAASDAIGASERLLVVLGVVIVGPVVEELVFRGVLLSVLRRRQSEWRAVLVSSGAFAALHLIDPNAALAVPFLFAAGIVMGRAVITTGRLGRAVAIHAGFNLVSVIALFST